MNLQLSDNNNYASYLEPEILIEVANTAKELNVEIYAVGGFVRDIILNRSNKDIDFVVLGSGIDFAKSLAKKTGKQANYFKNFGTAQIKIDDLELEFA